MIKVVAKFGATIRKAVYYFLVFALTVTSVERSSVVIVVGWVLSSMFVTFEKIFFPFGSLIKATIYKEITYAKKYM